MKQSEESKKLDEVNNKLYNLECDRRRLQKEKENLQSKLMEKSKEKTQKQIHKYCETCNHTRSKHNFPPIHCNCKGCDCKQYVGDFN